MRLEANKNTARLAGFLYLIVVVTGIFSLGYVPSQLFVWTDATQTFQNIIQHESLFRASLAGGAICYIAFLLLPLVLYFLLRSTGEKAAKLMVIFAVISVPISLLNLQNKYAVLTLVNGTDYTKFFNEQQLHSQTMLYLENYDHGILIVQIFWGLWLLPFGWLVYKSGFLPRILGILLMLGCVGYLVSFFGNTLFENYGKFAFAPYVRLPATLGEIGTCLWLLVRGINEKERKT